MQTTTTAKPLAIENENNKFNCDGFSVIHFAPPKADFKADGTYQGFLQKDFENVLLIKIDDKDIYVKLVDFLRIPFGYIGSAFTVPATGLISYDWKIAWLTKYPKTTNDTEMAVYTYLKEK